VVKSLKTLTTKFTKKDTNKHENLDPMRIYLRLILIRVIRVIRGKISWSLRSAGRGGLSPYLRTGHLHADAAFEYLSVSDWSLEQRPFCVICNTNCVNPATNCVNNTTKALQKLKCFKSSETRSNMPITRLEIVSFTFRFKVKRDQNASGTDRLSERLICLDEIAVDHPRNAEWIRLFEFIR
jgi:hypothetical protein